MYICIHFDLLLFSNLIFPTKRLLVTPLGRSRSRQRRAGNVDGSVGREDVEARRSHRPREGPDAAAHVRDGAAAEPRNGPHPSPRDTWDELYKNRSSRKIDSQRLFSRVYDFLKNFSLIANQFFRKTYSYTIACRRSRPRRD